VQACPTCVALLRSAPEDTRVVRLDASCPNCACEHGAVGLIEGASRVDDSERLYCVVVSPPDQVEENQLVFTMLTQAEVAGLSVLRQRASDDEFLRVARLRVQGGASRGQDRHVLGVAEFNCIDVRNLRADDKSPGRNPSARLFCVYDTDAESRFHADIFQTSPRGLGKNQTRAVRKKDREKLLALYKRATFIKVDDFRGGLLARL
jgi:hypothetical protein